MKYSVKMDKTIGYWIEKLSSYLFGLAISALTFYNWNESNFSNSDDFLKNIVSISATLFGFLLAILTLIIQGESKTIKKLKKHGSFKRLVLLNKRTVLSSIIICVFSFLLSIFKEDLFKINIDILKTLESINAGVFSFVVVNTLIFTLIFYRIIIADEEKPAGNNV